MGNAGIECAYVQGICARVCLCVWLFFKCIVNAFSPSISFAIEFGIIFHFSCASCRGHKWPEWQPPMMGREHQKKEWSRGRCWWVGWGGWKELLANGVAAAAAALHSKAACMSERRLSLSALALLSLLLRLLLKSLGSAMSGEAHTYIHTTHTVV